MRFLYFMFVFLSIADLVLSYMALLPIDEANPITRFLWRHYGYMSIVILKAASVKTVLLSTYYINQQGKSTYTIGVLSFACGILTIVCFQLWSLL